MPIEKASTHGLVPSASSIGVSSWLSAGSRLPRTMKASTTPAEAPSAESTTLSVSSWRTSRPRPAPSARRIAISRWRAAVRTSSRPATLAQAMHSTAAIIAVSRYSGRA